MARVLVFLAVCAYCRAAQSESAGVFAIQELIEKADWDGAAKAIQQALEKHADDAAVLNLRGVVHARRNELAAARDDFGTATRINPQLTPAWQNLARACQQLKQASCALDAWKQVLRSKPKDLEAHAALAQLHLDRREYAESLRDLAVADNLLVRCLDLTGLGRWAEARAVADRLAKQKDFSEADLAAMHGPLDDPKAAEIVVTLVQGLDSRAAAGLSALQRLTIAYERLRRPADARKTLERVALLDSNNSAHLLELARLAEEAKDHEGALGYLAHARDLAPNNARVHFLFGAIASEMNLPIEAKQSLDKALAMEPENPVYNYAMGSVILQTRDAATASGYFAKYVKAMPADGRGHYALGLAYFSAGDYENAKQEMQMAQKGDDLAPAADYYLGRIARLEGDWDEARRQLGQALVLRPKFAEPHTELGRIAMQNGKMGEAQSELAQAVRLAPESFQANEQLLVLYKRTHDSRAGAQEAILKKLDEERSRRAELMLRTLEMRP